MRACVRACVCVRVYPNARPALRPPCPGRLVLDPTSHPNWKMCCNAPHCNVIVLFKHVIKVGLTLTLTLNLNPKPLTLNPDPEPGTRNLTLTLTLTLTLSPLHSGSMFPFRQLREVRGAEGRTHTTITTHTHTRTHARTHTNAHTQTHTHTTSQTHTQHHTRTSPTHPVSSCVSSRHTHTNTPTSPTPRHTTPHPTPPVSSGVPSQACAAGGEGCQRRQTGSMCVRVCVRERERE